MEDSGHSGSVDWNSSRSSKKGALRHFLQTASIEVYAGFLSRAYCSF